MSARTAWSGPTRTGSHCDGSSPADLDRGGSVRRSHGTARSIIYTLLCMKPPRLPAERQAERAAPVVEDVRGEGLIEERVVRDRVFIVQRLEAADVAHV